MSCIKLYKGQDFICENWAKKYYQQLVLVNKDDVLKFETYVEPIFPVGIDPVFRHRITFELKDEKTGYLFRGGENSVSFYATFSKQLDDNIPQYSHNLQLPIMGAGEQTKGILKTLDNSNYFAAIQFM
ncbi:MAG TPA: hypothetical protein VFM82_03470, partial [Flavobacteriaceae bacterium]|nr:hypothetical protein [Flavobacteriaceae bacterium]